MFLNCHSWFSFKYGVMKPDVLLMDEPCSALDPISTSAIEDLITELKEDYTIVMVTHDPELARRAHRNVHVMDGQVTDLQPYSAKPLVRPEALAAG